jgi:protein tyrosine/serine phosphatase
MKEYHNGSAYRKKVAYACRFMNVHQGPYLIHCKVGRDRTGFMILLLECLMDAPFSYMLRDYEQSLINVNGYNWEKAHKVSREKLRDELHYITGKSRYTNWNNVKLRTYAEKYLKKCGLSAREILRLKKNLSKSYTKK